MSKFTNKDNIKLDEEITSNENKLGSLEEIETAIDKANFYLFNAKLNPKSKFEDIDGTQRVLVDLLDRKEDLLYGTHNYRIKRLETEKKLIEYSINGLYLIRDFKNTRRLKEINKELMRLREIDKKIKDEIKLKEKEKQFLKK